MGSNGEIRIGIALVFVFILALLTIRNWPDEGIAQANDGGDENLWQVIKGVGEAIRTPGMLGIAAGGISLTSSNIILGAWGGPYLNDVYGLNETGRGGILLFMAGTSVVSPYLFGLFARTLDSLKKVVLGGTTMILFMMAALALWPSPPLWVITILFAIIGLSCGFPTILLAHGRALMPPHLIGRGLTLVNTGMILSAGLMQIIVGVIIDATTIDGSQSTETSYQFAFGFIALMAAASWLIYARVEDRVPSDQ